MRRNDDYFPYEIQISQAMWDRLELGRVRAEMEALGNVPDVMFLRHAATRLNRQPDRAGRPVHARLMRLYALQTRILRYVIARYADEMQPGVLLQAEREAREAASSLEVERCERGFVQQFPATPVLDGAVAAGDFLSGAGLQGRRLDRVVREMLLLRVAAENPAIEDFRVLLDDAPLEAKTAYRRLVAIVESFLRSAPGVNPRGDTLPDLLRAPILASPTSLAGQMEYIRERWADLLPPGILSEIQVAFDVMREEEREWGGGGGGPAQVLEFQGAGGMAAGYPEYEAFSRDADWMSNVVLMAKMVYVWLDQMSRRYGRPIQRLDQIPDEEIDRLARWGFTGLWLIGLWERSPASQRIKQVAGNPDAIASAYSLYDYQVAWDLGGEEALQGLKDRLATRGIRLASDMVPNHTGLYSRWTVEHPDWFIQSEWPPYPAYRFTGPDVSPDPRISLRIEDGYWEKRDAAVVFQHVDNATGRVRYLYHGNDGTSTPWNDTAQLDYLLPEVREAVIRTILDVARRSPIIRFDAAMTLAKKHYQRLWYPQSGQGNGVPSRAEHGMTQAEFDRVFPVEFWREVVDRVAVEAPDTLLLAEAFWLMEGYFVRTLGMHRVYNSAFMNMLKNEDNANYRQTVKNVLEFNPEILKRFVNFMNNPDELTAVEQFGKEGKYVGAAVLLATMPGLPMFGHGQVEGFHEKYGMEFRKARWDEPVDEHLVGVHERAIFPLMRKRYLFSGSENFAFYDFFAGDRVNEDVFAYSNRAGDERGLILYHNRYASTAGWIRTSTAMAHKDAGGGMATSCTTLGKALQFDPSPGVFYAFRDGATGLEFLRAGRDLDQKGLYIQLGAYEYKAFLDFREIRDDDRGSWEQVEQHLAGAGTADLAGTFRRVRYAPVHEALAGLFDPAGTMAVAGREEAGTSRRLEAIRTLQARVRALAEALATREGNAADAAAVARAAEAFAIRLDAAGQGGEALDSSQGRVLLACLALPCAWSASGGGTGDAGWLDDLGLSGAIEEAGANGAHVPGRLLLRTVLENREAFQEMAASGLHAVFSRLLGSPLARTAIRLHAHDGVEYFHQEAFEELVAWLFRVARYEGGRADRQVVEALQVRAFEAARAAGYRVDRFLEILAQPERAL